MKRVPILLAACLVGATLVGPAQAQPGGGGPGGGGPGGGGPGGGGPGGGGPGGGGQASPTFSFEICNTSSSPTIYVTVVSQNGQQFRAQGWRKVPRGNQCTKIGDFQRPWIVVHAANDKGEWWGQADLKLCVNLNNSFDYTWDGKERCGAGEEIRPFKKIDVEPNSPGMKWTLHD